ncbi:MAG: hypothetical protein AB1846_01285 [Chloroflexota bacterium]
MPNLTKISFLEKLTSRYGLLKKLENTKSLFEIGGGGARIYIRYSKVHTRNQAFYGLRHEDLQRLEGFPSIICFLWDNQKEPLLISFSDYEEVFRSISPASDGQYKAMVFLDEATEFYIAGAGRFNVEDRFGFDKLDALIDQAKLKPEQDFSHSQIQTFLSAIGVVKGYDIWIPQNDRSKMDWSLIKKFDFREYLPPEFGQIQDILQEIDVIWLERGSNKIRALYEVEHSTPIYSGLLRFNDVLLIAPNMKPRFSIVANDIRRSLFVRQVKRPTFQASGLSELCTFFEYANVAGWFNRVQTQLTQI